MFRRRDPFPQDLDAELRQAVAVEGECYRRWMADPAARPAYLSARAESRRLYLLTNPGG